MKDEIKQKTEYCLGCKVSMCKKGCPLENDITEFVRLAKQEEYKKAYEKLCETTVLSPVCGRICPHKSQCEGSCIRGIKNEPVSIGEIEAFIGDMAIKNGYKIPKYTEEKKNKKIAIIGGGPTGLTVAAYLARNGYTVTIYEKYNKLGGILAHGIPQFRLEQQVLEDTIQKILELGIEVKYKTELGKNITIEELTKTNDAIFLAFGANISSKMEIPGENLQGVYGGNELLELQNHPNYEGKTVAVIGGGNVAMDTARTIKRLGAKQVNVIYRRAEKQMPAETKEIQAAKQEGINFLFQNNITKILGNNKVQKIECIKTELIKKQGETREIPVDIQGSNYEMDTDYVIMAVGSKPQTELLQTLDLQLTKRGHIQTTETYMTSKPAIFAAGDLTGTKATVAWASRSGREAAKEIIKFLEHKK